MIAPMVASLNRRVHLTPRDRKWQSRVPNWWRIVNVPARLREDEWPLIERIRLKGRIDDVSAFSGLYLFDPPNIYESDDPPPLDKNAPERLAAQREADKREAAAKVHFDWYNSPEQKRKRQAAKQRREADKAAMQLERLRQQQEYEALQRLRADEQRRRDEEWEAARRQIRLDEQVRLAVQLQTQAEHQARRTQQQERAAKKELQQIADNIQRLGRLQEHWSTPWCYEVALWFSGMGKFAVTAPEVQAVSGCQRVYLSPEQFPVWTDTFGYQWHVYL